MEIKTEKSIMCTFKKKNYVNYWSIYKSREHCVKYENGIEICLLSMFNVELF